MTEKTFEVTGITADLGSTVPNNIAAVAFEAYWLGVYRANTAVFHQRTQFARFDFERTEYAALRDQEYQLAEQALIDLKAAIAESESAEPHT